jgi:NAD(P)-dependent dehydrogenase (short-subunit alcohol dehydrogenase family)
MSVDNGENIVFITGVRRGIGRAVAVELAGRGWSIVGCSIHREGLSELSAELEERGAPRVWLNNADVSDYDDIGEWVINGVDNVGVPKVLIHNAAILGPRERFLDTSPEEWRSAIDINLNGAFNFLQATGGACNPEKRALWVWAISSVALRGRAGWGAYGASKAGVNNLNEAWAAENEGGGLWTSVAINPGGTRTDMRREAFPDEDPARLPKPSSVAKAFTAVVEKWERGELESGSVVEARDLMDL